MILCELVLYDWCMQVDGQFFFTGVPWELKARDYAAATLTLALSMHAKKQETWAAEAKTSAAAGIRMKQQVKATVTASMQLASSVSEQGPDSQGIRAFFGMARKSDNALTQVLGRTGLSAIGFIPPARKQKAAAAITATAAATAMGAAARVGAAYGSGHGDIGSDDSGSNDSGSDDSSSNAGEDASSAGVIKYHGGIMQKPLPSIEPYTARDIIAVAAMEGIGTAEVWFTVLVAPPHFLIPHWAGS